MINLVNYIYKSTNNFELFLLLGKENDEKLAEQATLIKKFLDKYGRLADNNATNSLTG